jgi:hypothetical protein
VQLAGLIGLPGSGSYNGVTLATLPVIYRPQGDKFLSVVSMGQSSVYGDNSGSGGLPRINIKTTGVVQLGGLPAGVNSSVVYIDGTQYPLDF